MTILNNYHYNFYLFYNSNIIKKLVIILNVFHTNIVSAIQLIQKAREIFFMLEINIDSQL